MTRPLSLCCLLTLLTFSTVTAQEDLKQQEQQQVQQPEPNAQPQVDNLEPHEQAFVELMSSAVMTGTFSMGDKPDQSPKQEKYTIQSVRKVSGDDWIVTARVTYGKIDVPVPVPVKMKWAGDTPVLQVTNLSIPLIGDSFTARVMFYEDYYAGAWWHGKVGGQMWGKLTKVTQPETSPEDKTEQKIKE